MTQTVKHQPLFPGGPNSNAFENLFAGTGAFVMAGGFIGALGSLLVAVLTKPDTVTIDAEKMSVSRHIDLVSEPITFTVAWDALERLELHGEQLVAWFKPARSPTPNGLSGTRSNKFPRE